MPSQTVTIVNKLGLHARATAKLVTCARQFESRVLLRRGDREVSVKSMMGLMMLAAGQGTELELETDGPDADAALQAVAELIANRFGEDA